jgi:hypothetical protein
MSISKSESVVHYGNAILASTLVGEATPRLVIEAAYDRINKRLAELPEVAAFGQVLFAVAVDSSGFAGERRTTSPGDILGSIARLPACGVFVGLLGYVELSA